MHARWQCRCLAGLLRCRVETLTFLFTDIEGSTALLGRLGEDGYEQLLAGHHAVIRSALAAHDGREVDRRGMRSWRGSPRRRGAWRRCWRCSRPCGAMLAGRGGGAGADGHPLREAARTATGRWAWRCTGPPGWPRSRTGGRCWCRRRRRCWCGTGCRRARADRSGHLPAKDLGRPERIFQLARRACKRSSRRCGRWITRRCRTISRLSCRRSSAGTGRWPRSGPWWNRPAWSGGRGRGVRQDPAGAAGGRRAADGSGNGVRLAELAAVTARAGHRRPTGSRGRPVVAGVNRCRMGRRATRPLSGRRAGPGRWSWRQRRAPGSGRVPGMAVGPLGLDNRGTGPFGIVLGAARLRG